MAATVSGVSITPDVETPKQYLTLQMQNQKSYLLHNKRKSAIEKQTEDLIHLCILIYIGWLINSFN
jgi:hypothetical protein